MAAFKNPRAEVFFKKYYLMTFDFGEFAFAIQYDGNYLHIFSEDTYYKFMTNWVKYIDEEFLESIEINASIFEQLERLSSKTVTAQNINEIWRLLRQTFTKQIELYYC